MQVDAFRCTYDATKAFCNKADMNIISGNDLDQCDVVLVEAWVNRYTSGDVMSGVNMTPGKNMHNGWTAQYELQSISLLYEAPIELLEEDDGLDLNI